MKSIIRVDLRDRSVSSEGLYRTEMHQHAAYRRLLGEQGGGGISFLMGDMIQVTDPAICTEQGYKEFLHLVQYCGGWVIKSGGEEEILDTARVFIMANLENFRRAFLASVPHAIIDDLSGPLPLRDHVRGQGELPDGKYAARKRKEADRLALLSIEESFTFADAARRAGEVMKERPYLQTEIAIVIGKWRPMKGRVKA